MKRFIQFALVSLFGLGATSAMAAHHEGGHSIAPVGTTGQVVVVYYWPCADSARGLGLLKTMIAYERTASTHPYSAAPALHEDGALVSIDLHPSAASFEQATAWQNDDATWQGYFAEMVDACGSADDLSTETYAIQ